MRSLRPAVIVSALLSSAGCSGGGSADLPASPQVSAPWIAGSWQGFARKWSFSVTPNPLHLGAGEVSSVRGLWAAALFDLALVESRGAITGTGMLDASTGAPKVPLTVTGSATATNWNLTISLPGSPALSLSGTGTTESLNGTITGGQFSNTAIPLTRPVPSPYDRFPSPPGGFGVLWTSSDSTRVRVTAGGSLVAMGNTTGVQICGTPVADPSLKDCVTITP
jgi:hypothetical protein